MKKAIFASGCFWGPEEKLSKIKGITKTEVGYCGGNNSKTSYEEVCAGQTNHAEVVKIEFDEKVISYEELVNFFFTIHDPTTFNRQGPNVGSQYRSEIFFCDDEQKKIAGKVKENLIYGMNFHHRLTELFSITGNCSYNNDEEIFEGRLGLLMNY